MSEEARKAAIQFHETYERLAPQFGYETRPDTKAFDPDSPNGRLMIAVCGEVLNALAATPADPVREAATALVAAAEAVVDDDPCWFDHNGNCQAHSISQPCTNAVLIGAIVNAKTALEAK